MGVPTPSLPEVRSLASARSLALQLDLALRTGLALDACRSCPVSSQCRETAVQTRSSGL